MEGDRSSAYDHTPYSGRLSVVELDRHYKFEEKVQFSLKQYPKPRFGGVLVFLTEINDCFWPRAVFDKF